MPEIAGFTPPDKKIPVSPDAKRETKIIIDKIKLKEFDMAYLQSLQGEGVRVALGRPEFKNQHYFTVCADGGEVDGEKVGIMGVFDTKDDLHVSHTVVQEEYRGQGLATKFKDTLMARLNLPYLTLLIDATNAGSLNAASKLPNLEKLGEYIDTTGKLKVRYIYKRPEKN